MRPRLQGGVPPLYRGTQFPLHPSSVQVQAFLRQTQRSAHFRTCTISPKSPPCTSPFGRLGSWPTHQSTGLLRFTATPIGSSPSVSSSNTKICKLSDLHDFFEIATLHLPFRSAWVVAYSPAHRTASLHGHAYRFKSSSLTNPTHEKSRSDERLLLAFGCGDRTGTSLLTQHIYFIPCALGSHRGLCPLLALPPRLSLRLQPLYSLSPPEAVFRSFD